MQKLTKEQTQYLMSKFREQQAVMRQFDGSMYSFLYTLEIEDILWQCTEEVE